MEKARQWKNINDLCDIVRETSFAIHKYHRCGHLEKIYENALVHRLRKQGLRVEQQYPLTVMDEDGTVLGDYFADLYVEDCLIIELKACKAVVDEHVAQLLGYLTSARVETGLLINFGTSKLHVKNNVTIQSTEAIKQESITQSRRDRREEGKDGGTGINLVERYPLPSPPLFYSLFNGSKTKFGDSENPVYPVYLHLLCVSA